MKAEIKHPVLQEITGIFEDTVQHVCEEYRLSGQLVWTIVETLATAKLREFPDNDN